MSANRNKVPDSQGPSQLAVNNNNLMQLFVDVPEVEGARERYLGKGNFGEVFAFRLDDGKLIAVKFIMPDSTPNSDAKQLALLKKEIDINLGMQAQIEEVSHAERMEYSKRVNTLTPIIIANKLTGKKSYGLESEVAKFDLRQFLTYIATNSSLLNEDTRIFASYKKDPLRFIELIVDRMRSCLLAMHGLDHIHLDVAARNFLVYGFQFDSNGELQDIDLKISDFGRAVKLIPTHESMCDLPRDSAHPLRYLDQKAFQGKVNILSDLYALKVTIITILEILMRGMIETTLSLKPYTLYREITEGDAEYKLSRSMLSDNDALKRFLGNAEQVAKSILKSQKKLMKLNMQSAQDKFKSLIASSCLQFIEKYRPYLEQPINNNVSVALSEESNAWAEVINKKLQDDSDKERIEKALKTSTGESEDNSSSDSEKDSGQGRNYEENRTRFSSVDDYSLNDQSESPTILSPKLGLFARRTDLGLSGIEEFPIDEIKSPEVRRHANTKEGPSLVILSHSQSESSESGTESEPEEDSLIISNRNDPDGYSSNVSVFNNISSTLTVIQAKPDLWSSLSVEDDFPKDEFKSPSVFKKRIGDVVKKPQQEKEHQQFNKLKKNEIFEISDGLENSSRSEDESESKPKVEGYADDISETSKSTAIRKTNNATSFYKSDSALSNHFSSLSIEDSPLSSADVNKSPTIPNTTNLTNQQQFKIDLKGKPILGLASDKKSNEQSTDSDQTNSNKNKR